MEDDPLLLIPGPVPITPEVQSAMDAPMISRRSPAFKSIYQQVSQDLRYVFTKSTLDGSTSCTGGRTLLLNGTATMAMEAAVANLARPDDDIVVLSNGKFGQRFGLIAERYGSTTTHDVEWGASFDIDSVEKGIENADIVAMVHNETSTGLLNPVGSIGPIVRENNGLFIVDGVSSVGGDEFIIDEWGIDVAITDPQKALASPPGISAMFLTDRAVAAVDSGQSPFYFNLEDHLAAAADSRTPYTVASPQVRGMAVALTQLREEGMPARIRRHRSMARAVREAVLEMGLNLFPNPAEPTTYSNTLTAVATPKEIRDSMDEFSSLMASRGVSVGGGLDQLAGKLIRISNMGAITVDDLITGLRAVGESFVEMGADLDTEAGLDVAHSILDQSIPHSRGN